MSYTRHIFILFKINNLLVAFRITVFNFSYQEISPRCTIAPFHIAKTNFVSALAAPTRAAGCVGHDAPS